MAIRLSQTKEAALYNRKMHNKFFVPIWAAAMNADESVGYIMYPRLIPLEKVLLKCKIENTADEKAQKRLMEVLRRCFAPIALALDALHTPIPNQRTMYYHRDLSIKKVYMCESPQVSPIKDHPIYGDALLKLSKLTRGSYQEEMNISQTIGNFYFSRKYFHHPDAFSRSDDNIYLRKHDWFSFGVYILEVLLIVLPMDSTDQIEYYKNVDQYIAKVKKLKKFVRTSLEWHTDLSRDKLRLLHYLSLAKKCMALKECPNQEMHYEFSEMKKRFKTVRRPSFQPYHFEYGVSAWTAELLWMYDDSFSESAATFVLSRPGSVFMKKIGNERKLCQACLLRDAVKIPTRTYRRTRGEPGEEERSSVNEFLQCDEDSCGVYYCTSCHTNGERLFCPDHGTTSSALGHFASYALILYGYEKNDIFKRDAQTLENVLKHKLVVGIPEDNVVVAPVFDKQHPGKEEDCLEKACTEIRRRIHNRQYLGNTWQDSGVCVNDASYTLVVFYSGHGSKGDEEMYQGHWCPVTEEHLLTWDVINKHLDLLRHCTNKNNPTCKASCLEVITFMDYCGASKKSFGTSTEQNADGQVPLSLKVSSPYSKETFASESISEITAWFCDFLTSKLCSKKVNCKHCCEIRKYVVNDCYNAYLDSYSLKLYSKHRPQKERPEVVPEQTEDLILAHFYPSGICYKIFSYKEGKFQ
ncbi:uncharacterized protein [Watersipora subatra]|uniref:uncharacterized protein n=1 Tax=Watersipora subatra TaxID=2589382 RepID=UPI00355C0BC7